MEKQMSEIEKFINGTLQIIATENLEEQIVDRYNLMMEEWLEQFEAYSAWSRDREAEMFANFDCLV